MRGFTISVCAVAWLIAAIALRPAPIEVSCETPAPVATTTVATTTPVHVKHSSKVSPEKVFTLAQAQVQREIVAVFADAPAMDAVIRCESHYAQLCAPEVNGMGLCTPEHYGEPLESVTGDVGVGQINIKTWGALAKQLGLDIYYSEADNIAMTRIIYERQGISAWVCSRYN